jgi:hypothetical protein
MSMDYDSVATRIEQGRAGNLALIAELQSEPPAKAAPIIAALNRALANLAAAKSAAEAVS